MVCVWCSLGVTIYVLLTYVHGVTSCILTRYHIFSLALGLDQMIWSWLVFVSLTKIMKQEHGRNEEKSEKAWNKIMAIMSQSYLAMKIVQACILSLKAQWGHASKYPWFLVFLVSTKSLLNQFGFFDVMLHTCPAQLNRSIRNRFWQCWGWSNHSWCRGSTATTTTTTTATTTTTSSSAKLAPGPARHELTHLRTLILGELGLPTMQDHGTALLLLNGCGYCLDMIVTIFLIDITSSFCIIQSLLVSLDFVHNLSQPSKLKFVGANLRVVLENFEHWVFPGANTDSPLVFCWKTERLCWWTDS